MRPRLPFAFLLVVLSLVTPSSLGALSWGAAGSPDFSFTVSRNSLETLQSTPNGANGVGDDLNITGLNGFTGLVHVEGLSSPTGLSICIQTCGGTHPSSTDITICPTCQHVPVSVTVSSNTPGIFNFTLAGTSGSLSHSIQIPVTVDPSGPDFYLSPKRVQLYAVPGGSYSTVYTVTSLYGFTGQVSFYAPFVDGSISLSFNPRNVTLSPGGNASTTVRFTIASNALFETHAFLVNASSTVPSHVYQALELALVGVVFGISPNPSRLTIPLGSSATSTITVGNPTGSTIFAYMSATVKYTGLQIACPPACPSLPNATLSVATVTISPGASFAAMLTVNAAGASAGNFTVVISATGCNCAFPDANVTVFVPDGPMNPLVDTVLGVFRVVAHGAFSVNIATQTLVGNASVLVTNANGSRVLDSDNFTVSMKLVGNTASFVLEPRLVAVGVLCQADVLAWSASCAAMVNADANHDGVVNIGDLALLAASFGSGPGDVRWNPACDLNGDGRINIMDLTLVAIRFGQRFNVVT